MPSAVLDAAILVSAFFAPRGLSTAILQQAREGVFAVYLSEAILTQTQRVLLEEEHIRRRYHYSDEKAFQFIAGLRVFAPLVTPLPDVVGISRDPNDDVILASARAAQAAYLVTRDLDLLSLQTYEDTTIITPEAFMAILREQDTRRAEDDIQAGETP